MTIYPMGTASLPLRMVAEDKGNRIPERLLARFWKERAARLTVLRTEAGKRVRVVYPGRSGVTAGPDFRDALLEVEGVGMVRGDVELHIRQKDWDAHGHGGDPNYNGVVFHGALEVDSEETKLQSGVSAPVVDLNALLAELPMGNVIGQPRATPLLDLWQVLSQRGFSRPSTIEEVGEILDRAGDLRFRWKAGWLLQCIEAEGPDQALYQGLLEGLGYRSNQRPFIELASAAPYRQLAQAALKLPSAERCSAFYEWLITCSGLEPLRSRQMLPKSLGPAMDKRAWRLFRVRPTNHPRNRIMGAAVILDRYLGSGLADGLREKVERLSPAKLATSLCANSDFGPAYIGLGRAKDLVVNVVLPFMLAWDVFQGRQSWAEVESTAEASGIPELTYRKFSLLTKNEITREMTTQLLPIQWRGIVTSARRQQGLLHLAEVLKGAF